jgi:hypothetical protein
MLTSTTVLLVGAIDRVTDGDVLAGRAAGPALFKLVAIVTILLDSRMNQVLLEV